MKPKTMILLVVAVACGLVASYMTSRVIADRATTPEVAKVPVVYAIKNVSQGQLIKNPDDFFQQRMMPEDVAPRGKVIREVSELKDKRIINPIGADKHVSQDDLLGGQENSLSYRIPSGMRAVSVKVSQDTSVSGFVLPGMHVDIMCVPNGKNECKTILQKVQILAVNALSNRPEDGKANVETHFVTFSVNPDDSEKLTLAAHHGHLRLSLRHHDDDKIASTRGAKAEDLTRLSLETGEGTDQPETAATTPQTVPIVPPTTQPVVKDTPKAEPAQPKLLWTMTIRNGTRVEQQKFFDEPPVDIEKSDPDSDPKGPTKPPSPEPKTDTKVTEPAPTGETKPDPTTKGSSGK